MKTYILSWEEYMWTGNDAILDTLPENVCYNVLCSGECLLQAKSAKEAQKRWKRLFPRSMILWTKEKAC